MIVLNGGSSSGKSEILRCLQAVLPDPWLAAPIDSLVDAMPESLRTSDGIEFADDGYARLIRLPGYQAAASSSTRRGGVDAFSVFRVDECLAEGLLRAACPRPGRGGLWVATCYTARSMRRASWIGPWGVGFGSCFARLALGWRRWPKYGVPAEQVADMTWLPGRLISAGSRS